MWQPALSPADVTSTALSESDGWHVTATCKQNRKTGTGEEEYSFVFHLFQKLPFVAQKSWEHSVTIATFLQLLLSLSNLWFSSQ